MVTKRYELDDLLGSEINLGRVGENRARCIEFDVRQWIALYPDSFVMVFVIPPSPSMPYRPSAKPHQTPSAGYIAATEFADGIVSWPISSTDTQHSGTGAAELILYGKNGEIKQSTVIKTRISKSISHTGAGGCGCAPSPMQPWVDQVAQLRIDTEYAADRAEAAAELVQNVVIENTIPDGGKTNQVLGKLSDRDKDIGWIDLPDHGQEASNSSVVNAETMADFPVPGDPNKIYKAEAELKLYQWNAAKSKYEPLAYEEPGDTVDNITIIHGGDAYGTN